ncbi:hypothetical protein VDQ94_01650 [Xanthomonas campestris pv. campestris]|nr:hypothetical protein [Xanthomonas campestris pv. campestris]MEB1554611.1 hypothetical protein [Xanthomonas campestris pv. campestris]
MTEKKINTPRSAVSADFGYYPYPCDVKTKQFTIKTLSNHKSTVEAIKSHPNVINEWLYPGPQKNKNFLSEHVYLMPYNKRIFHLPKTHKITLHKSVIQEEVDFIVWCLSFFTGIRLTTTEAGFLDAATITAGKLVDFSLSGCNLSDAIGLSLNYLKAERNAPRALRRVEAVIHALFLAQYPHSLPFEQFQYLYMALDACFSLVIAKEKIQTGPANNNSPPKNLHVPHGKRIQYMCEKFSLPVPDWAGSTTNITELSSIRNDVLHEALFFGQPLGFAIYGGNEAALNHSNVTLQMQALVCRLLVAILGKPGVSYVKTPVDTRQRHALELRPRPSSN